MDGGGEEEVVRKRPNTFRASSPNSADPRQGIGVAGTLILLPVLDKENARIYTMYIYGSRSARARNSWNDRPPLTPTVTSSLSREAEFPRTVYRR